MAPAVTAVASAAPPPRQPHVRCRSTGARAAGIGQDRLPDFLDLEAGGELVLLGQEELDVSVVERDLQRRLADWKATPGGLTERETERVLVAAARVGQHVFAARVLSNCGHRCVFCGLAPPSFNALRLLLASHIKPWRDSSDRERLDHRNGLAACPTHDVAFDVGLLTVNRGLRIHTATRLSAAVAQDEIARRYFDRPPLKEVLLLPDGADPPAAEYLDWHRRRVFAAWRGWADVPAQGPSGLAPTATRTHARGARPLRSWHCGRLRSPDHGTAGD